MEWSLTDEERSRSTRGRFRSEATGGAAVLDTHHRAYGTGRLELLPHLEPQWRAEVAHAVMHLGLIGAVRRLAPGRR
jgi:hypothetical protein